MNRKLTFARWARGIVALAINLGACGVSQAQYPVSSESSPYMGAPVTPGKAPNGAITNQKLLDGAGAFNWLEPTIENPAEGIWVFGGYGLAPMSIIEAEDGRQ